MKCAIFVRRSTKTRTESNCSGPEGGRSVMRSQETDFQGPGGTGSGVSSPCLACLGALPREQTSQVLMLVLRARRCSRAMGSEDNASTILSCRDSGVVKIDRFASIDANANVDDAGWQVPLKLVASAEAGWFGDRSLPAMNTSGGKDE